jgi:serine/threonine-protein kinase
MSYEPGQKVGDYEILEVLGAGGMGEVYKVRNVISDRMEAMKVLLPDLATQQELAGRFLREIKVLAGLDHPNIAALRTASQVGNQLIMIMELVEGTTLAHRLRAGAFPEREAVDFVDQVLAALSYAHGRGIVHRDIKPANMMLTRTGVVKLMDFGIAHAAGETKLTQTGSTLGSIYYMSPEQVQGSAIDTRSDLYSLGVSLYEMVTAQHPFEGDTSFTIMKGHIEGSPVPPREVNPDISPALNEVVLRSMAKDPNQRYQNADEFAGALQGVRRALATSTRAIHAVAPPVSPTLAATTPTRPAFTQPAAAGAQPAMPSTPPPAPHTPTRVTQSQPAAAAAPTAPATAAAPPAGGKLTELIAGVTPSSPAPATAPSAPPAQTVAQTPPSAGPAPRPEASGPPPVPRSSRALYIALGSVLTLAFLVLTAMKIPGLLGSSPSKPAAVTPANPSTTPAPANATPSQPPAPTPSAGGATQPDASAGNPPAAAPSGPSPAEIAAEKAKKAREAEAKKEADAAAAAAAAKAQAEAEAAAKLFDEQENRFIHMSARAAAMKTSYETLRNQQAASGYSPNQDLTMAVTTMDQYMSRADAALSTHDGATAKKYMDLAEPQIEKLERKFGR